MMRRENIEHAVVLMLSEIEPRGNFRKGIEETPQRVAKAFAEWFGGYEADIPALFKTFTDGAERCDEMIVLDNIPVQSHCVVGSTFVETPRGRVPISWLRHRDWVYSLDPETFELGLVRCENPRITRRNARLVKVYADNDTVICTPDHRFLQTDGNWIEARAMTSGTRLASLYRVAAHAKRDHVTLLSSQAGKQSQQGGVKIAGRAKHESEHRAVLRLLGQALEEDEIVHHKDEVAWNNLPENLESMSKTQHNIEHQRTKKFEHSELRKQRAAEASRRPEAKHKKSEANKSHWSSYTPEQRAARCEAMRAGIAAAGKRNHEVIGVEDVSVTDDVWCMEVPGTQVFFANGMAVHNCEHHMAPFVGTAVIGYIPNGKIIGLSKIPKLVNAYSKRLQVQERLTNQIADAMMDHLDPKGMGIVIRAEHFCMATRGVHTPGVFTTTSSLRGVFREPGAREEFLSFARRSR